MQFTFDNPVYLWYLFTLPLLVITHFLALKGAKRKAMNFANFQTLKRIAGKRFVTKNIPILIIRLLTLSLLIFSAAGVHYWYASTQAENNYVLAIDVSSSMIAQDVAPTRLDAAKQYSLDFIDSIDLSAKVAVVTFSGITLIEEPLTNDRAALRAAINNIDVAKAGGTDIPGALITGTNLLLAEEEKGRVIILFTDGSSTAGAYVDNSMTVALNYLQENQVLVNAIGIGTESGPIGYLPEFYNITSVYDQKNLLYITNQTGGMLIPAQNDVQLEEAYTTLLDKADEGLVNVPLSNASLIGALLLLFVEWGLINSRFRRIT